MKEIHRKALDVAARFKQAEADLISVLQEVEAGRVFVISATRACSTTAFKRSGCRRMSPRISSLSRERLAKFRFFKPRFKAGSLSVSKARKITPVLTLANQDEWVEKAKLLSTRKLEEEVARVAPREATPERIKFVTEDRLELRLGISKARRKTGTCSGSGIATDCKAGQP